MITIFTPSFADAANTNAQNLTVKAVFGRLPPERFHLTLLYTGEVDARIAARPNTHLIPYLPHGNTPLLLAHVMAQPPDIYFFPREGPLDIAFLTLHQLGLTRSRVVTYIVSGGLQTYQQPRSRILAARQGDRLVGNSRSMAREIAQRFGRAPHATIYDGIEPELFYPPPHREYAEIVGKTESKGADAPRLRVLYAGSFRPYKRADVVVEQAARWPQVDFVLVGTGEEEPVLRRMAAETGCANVAFLGHLPAAELGAQMRAADIFFFPSEIEGHPQVLGQAAASGLPCVALRSYEPDYVVDGSTGFLCNSYAEMAERLEQLLRDATLRQRMGEAGILHAAQFTWERVTDDWARVFEDVMAEGRRG